MASQTIYIELLEEGVDVWRPVLCVEHADEAFQLPTDAPDDERWAFVPGSIVKCEWRELEPGRVLVATQLLD